ncbi:MAG: glutathione S-transferase family protein, partial [Pseudomonadales bacterium]|nr:glutathione S-transferase family protein [Pseudomonadales bacterium]
MKLYNSVGPNPHVVRMFAAEVGIHLDLEEIDIMAGANRQAKFLEINPSGQLPCLATDDGDLIAEITAICEYLDEVGQGPSLMGTTPEERANTRMWTRRVDLNICEPLANGFRYSEGLPIFKDRMVTIPQAADDLKRIARDKLAWLNTQMQDNRAFVGGENISLADVLLY